MKFSEEHRGRDKVKLTKRDKIEWGEKCHYPSDIRFEWPHVLIYFIVILFYIGRK